MASEATGVSELATRYAAALFELASEQKVLDQVARDLASVKQMLVASTDLSRLLSSAATTRAEQAAVMEALLDKAEASDLTKRFIGLVAGKRRLFALGKMIDAYLEDLAVKRGRVAAQVTVARALTDAQTAQLTDALKQAVGPKVTVDVSINPELIGGMIVKIGSRMIDSSLRTKLDRLQIALNASGGPH